MSRWENKFSRKSQAISKPSRSSVISHASWNRAVPVERMLRRAERFGSETSGMGWFCKAKRTSKSGLYPASDFSPSARANSTKGMALANESTRLLMARSQMIGSNERGRTFVKLGVIAGLAATLLMFYPTGDGQARTSPIISRSRSPPWKACSRPTTARRWPSSASRTWKNSGSTIRWSFPTRSAS